MAIYISRDNSESLAHHGVKGMKWGIRNDNRKSSSPAQREADSSRKRIDKATAKAMSSTSRRGIQRSLNRLDVKRNKAAFQARNYERMSNFTARSAKQLARQELSKSRAKIYSAEAKAYSNAAKSLVNKAMKNYNVSSKSIHRYAGTIANVSYYTPSTKYKVKKQK